MVVSSTSSLENGEESKKSKNMVNGDRISNLPDTLLHQILSYLDITEVFQTVILSKKWKSLFTSLPFLNFDYKAFFTLKLKKKDIIGYTSDQIKDLERFCHEEFMDVVNKVIIFHDNDASKIKTIRLLGSFGYANTTWLHVAVLGNLQELDLYLISGECKFKLAQCLVTCKSLVTLKLEIELMESFRRDGWTFVCVDLPKLVNLPKLKTLQLRSFCFYGGSKFIQKFLLGSPVLETLSIIKCGFHQTSNVSMSPTQVKHLEVVDIYGCEGCCGIYTTFPKFEVTVLAPMLVSLKIKGYISDKYLAVGLSSLVRADIDLVKKDDGESDTDSSDSDRDTDNEADSAAESEDYSGAYRTGIKTDGETAAAKEVGINVMLLLASVCNAKSLMVSTSLLEVIGEDNGHLPIPFSTLRQLRLKTMLSRESIRGIKYILRNSCILEKLLVEIVRKKASTQTKIWEFWGADLSDLEGIFCYLKFAEFRNVRGCLIELEVLKGLLKNATALEKLIIFTSKGQPFDSRRQLMKKIMEFPKASSSAAVSFF